MRALAILAAALLSGCALFQPSPLPVFGGSFCEIAEPIVWSKDDTADTVTQIKEHNAIGKRLCHWTGHAVTPSPAK